jgi:hypothetical protein
MDVESLNFIIDRIFLGMFFSLNWTWSKFVSDLILVKLKKKLNQN